MRTTIPNRKYSTCQQKFLNDRFSQKGTANYYIVEDRDTFIFPHAARPQGINENMNTSLSNSIYGDTRVSRHG